MAASCISNATSPHGFLIPPHRYLRDRQSEEQRAGGCLLPHGNACPREQGDGALATGTAAFRGGRRSRDSSESGTLLGVGPGLCRTSENAVKTKFTPARSEESWQAVATCYRLSQEYRDPFVLPSNSVRASGRGYRPPARRCRSLDLASKFGRLRFAPLPFSEL